MAVVRYTARRSLIIGVNSGETVTQDLPLKYAGMVLGRTSLIYSRKSLGRVREAYHYYGEDTYTLTTRPMTEVEQASMAMFLASVEDQQTFEFAPYDNAGDSPIDWRNVTLDGDGYSFEPHPGREERMTASFTISEAP